MVRLAFLITYTGDCVSVSTQEAAPTFARQPCAAALGLEFAYSRLLASNRADYNLYFDSFGDA